jgi:hypothetical protein
MTSIDLVCWLVSFLLPQRMFVVYDLTPFGKLCSSLYGKGLLYKLCEHRVILMNILSRNST